MNMKKSTFIISIIAAALVSAMLTAIFINPFGAGNWRSLIVAKISGSGESLSKFNETLYMVKRFFYEETDEKALTSTALKSMVDSLNDEYSEYMTESEFKAFREQTEQNYTGIGIRIVRGDDGLITVVAPIAGSPAYEAHIAANDKILAVDGESFSGDNMDGAVEKMKGEEGTPVSVTVLKADSGETVELNLIRSEITMEVTDGKLLDGNIAYISVYQFTHDTVNQFSAKFEELRAQGAESLILDLRGNPGGFVDVAIKMADIFMDGGLVAYMEYRDGTRRNFSAKPGSTDIPMVILTNGGSASASEILAGALHDTGRAYLIGEKTFGKGVVQEASEIDGDALKLTTARYFTPNGVCVHGVGIEPDLNVPMSYEDYYLYVGSENDVQLEAALKYIRDGGKN